MDNEKRAYLELHIAVFLFGFTAILGALIQLSALVIVWWRVLITSLSLFFLIRGGKGLRGLGWPTRFQFMGVGILIAVHWLAFYGAIKLANASIALICMATTSFFTAFLEPFIMKQRLSWHEVLIGMVIIPGMGLIANNTSPSMGPGILAGLSAALMAALFATLNKKLVGRPDEMSVTFLELGSAWIFLSLILSVYIIRSEEPPQVLPGFTDWLYLIILSLLCTTLAYVLALRALRHLSAFTSNLAINLEPVYGIALAWLILDDGEELSPGFYCGVLIILAAVLSYPLLGRRLRQRRP